MEIISTCIRNDWEFISTSILSMTGFPIIIEFQILLSLIIKKASYFTSKSSLHGIFKCLAISRISSSFLSFSLFILYRTIWQVDILRLGRFQSISIAQIGIMPKVWSLLSTSLSCSAKIKAFRP